MPKAGSSRAIYFAGKIHSVGKLAASIVAADLAHLGDQVKMIEEYADVMHIDLMDAHFVPPLTIGPPVVKSLRPVTDRVLHAHLMVDTPEGLFDELAEAGADVVSFHLEAAEDAEPVIRKARGAGLGVGLVLNMETPLDKAFPLLDELDDVMLMSIRPGWSGQTLNPEVFGRVEKMRAELDRRGLGADLEVDGGIKIDNAQRAVDAGATVLIAASAIFWQTDPREAARELASIARGA